LACLTLVYLTISVLGVWNPRHYVILLTYFNNPLGDAAAVMSSA